jgi:predicted RNA-binding Zn-ribbon protein involved in translation (DUF1610 family)
MPFKQLDQRTLGKDEDWVGNNAAFRCPHCGKVFLVSGTRIQGGTPNRSSERKCPDCGKSTGRCDLYGCYRRSEKSANFSG